jgi:hypothetical protein
VSASPSNLGNYVSADTLTEAQIAKIDKAGKLKIRKFGVARPLCGRRRPYVGRSMAPI